MSTATSPSHEDTPSNSLPELASQASTASTPDSNFRLSPSNQPRDFPEPSFVSPDTPEAETSVNVPEFVELQRQILNVLTKMSEKMDRVDAERPVAPGANGEDFRKAPPKNFLPDQHFGQGNEDYDAEQLYPEDEYGQELGPNARVFAVYNKEAAASDIKMITKAGESSDMLLVFAGLFSAVVTTFVAQTSQALEVDNMAISNALLSEIAQLQRAQINGTSLETIENAVMTTTPSNNDVWVNGLWFTSLTLSLTVALFAVLTKQWLRQYMSTTTGTLRDRCLLRQFRFAGMRKWHVLTVISVLPIFLHLALGIFLVGLIIFLVPRSLLLAYVVGGMIAVIICLYIIASILPAIDIQCPYLTPLSEIINIIHYQCRPPSGSWFWFRLGDINFLQVPPFIFISFTLEYLLPQSTLDIVCITVMFIPLVSSIIAALRVGYPSLSALLNLIHYQFGNALAAIWVSTICMARRRPCRSRRFDWFRHILTSLKLSMRLLSFRMGDKNITPPFKTLADLEYMHVQKESVTSSLSLDVIMWLLDTSSNPSVHNVALQAIGGLPPSQERKAGKLLRTFTPLVRRLVDECSASDGVSPAIPTFRPKLERIARLCSVNRNVWNLNLEILHTAFQDVDYIQGMISTVPLLYRTDFKRKPARDINIFCLITQLESQASPAPLTFPPLAWKHLFEKSVLESSSSEFQLKISQIVLGEWSCPSWRCSNWDDTMNPVSMSVALAGSPMTIRQIFKTYDPWKSVSFPPPASPQMLALLSLHSFLETSVSSSLTEIERLTLLISVWESISIAITQDRITLQDCLAVFNFSNLCLISSSLLAGDIWDPSREPRKQEYCKVVLQSCHAAFKKAGFGLKHYPVRSWEWICLDRVIAIMRSRGTMSLRYNAQELWETGLKFDIPDAYTSFVTADILQDHDPHGYQAGIVVGHFVAGLTRQSFMMSMISASEKSIKCFSDSMKYLHQPDNLLSACKILASTFGQKELLVLARLDPDNDVWSSCLARLTGDAWTFGVLDTFFKKRRRLQEIYHRYNPLGIIMGNRTHTNSNQSFDIERPPVSAVTISQQSVVHSGFQIPTQRSRTSRLSRPFTFLVKQPSHSATDQELQLQYGNADAGQSGQQTFDGIISGVSQENVGSSRRGEGSLAQSSSTPTSE